MALKGRKAIARKIRKTPQINKRSQLWSRWRRDSNSFETRDIRSQTGQNKSYNRRLLNQEDDNKGTTNDRSRVWLFDWTVEYEKNQQSITTFLRKSTVDSSSNTGPAPNSGSSTAYKDNAFDWLVLMARNKEKSHTTSLQLVATTSTEEFISNCIASKSGVHSLLIGMNSSLPPRKGRRIRQT
jgi:hypothetical protein